MPAELISEGLDGHYYSGDTNFLAKCEPKKLNQTFYGTLAELAQQFEVVEKESAQDFRNGENILSVGNRIENRFLEVVAELDHFLVMT